MLVIPVVSLGTLCNTWSKITGVDLRFLSAGGSIQNASEQFVSCIRLYFVNLTLHPTPKTKI
jgi:hypothetical protein